MERQERQVSGTAFGMAFVGAALGTIVLLKPDVVEPFVPDVSYPVQTYHRECEILVDNEPTDGKLSESCELVADDMAPVYGEQVANVNREVVDLTRQGLFGLAASMIVAGAIVRIGENKKED